MSRESQQWVTFPGNDCEVNRNPNSESKNVTPRPLKLLQTQWKRENNEKNF